MSACTYCKHPYCIMQWTCLFLFIFYSHCINVEILYFKVQDWCVVFSGGLWDVPCLKIASGFNFIFSTDMFRYNTVMCTYHAGLKHNLRTQQHDFMHDSCLLYGDCFLWQLQSCFFFFLLLFLLPFFCNVHKEMYVSFLCFNRSSICCRIHPVRVCSFGCFVLPWFCRL